MLRHVAPTTFQAKIDAEGWFHEERKLIEANEWSPPKHRAEMARAVGTTPDFETYAKKWITKRRTDKGEPLRASTRANCEATLEHHLVPTFGRMRLCEAARTAVSGQATARIWRSSGTREASGVVGVAAVDDRDDLDDQALVDNPVDHSVLAAAGGQQWGEWLTQQLATFQGSSAAGP